MFACLCCVISISSSLYQHTWPMKSALFLILPPCICSLSLQGTPGAPGAPGNTGPSGKQGELGPPVSLSVSESDTGCLFSLSFLLPSLGLHS